MGIHFTFALLAFNQGRVGRKKRKQFLSPLFSYSSFLHQCVTYLHPSVQADLFPRLKKQRSFAFAAHDAPLHCPGSFLSHSSISLQGTCQLRSIHPFQVCSCWEIQPARGVLHRDTRAEGPGRTVKREGVEGDDLRASYFF